MPSSATTRETSAAIEAFVRLVRANAAVTRQLSAQLSADHGLNLSAYEALLQLARAPDSRMRRVDLANGLLLTAGGVTRLLDGLERDGFVAREECSSDRRVSYAVLTKAGRDKLREASKSHTRQIRELMGRLYDEDELAQLAALLERLPGVDPTTSKLADEWKRWMTKRPQSNRSRPRRDAPEAGSLNDARKTRAGSR
jgi:DNA-binding MarR family transcriptional regulator